MSEIDSVKGYSRITIVTSGTDMVIEQIKALLDRLVPVHMVEDLTVQGPCLERELALVKVVNAGESRIEALRIADMFRARAIDSTLNSFVFELTGNPKKLNAFIELMSGLGKRKSLVEEWSQWRGGVELVYRMLKVNRNGVLSGRA